MAKRATATRKQFLFGLNANTVTLDGYGSVDGSHLFVNQTFSGGTISYASSAGVYDIVLDQPYNYFLSCHVEVHSPASNTALNHFIKYQNVTGATDASGNPAKTIRVVFHSAGTPTDLPAGAGFNVAIKVKDSVLKPGS
jgi:hypothetical protein